MAAYADWTYYSVTFLGAAIAQADAARLLLRASEQIDKVTYGRAAAVILAATDTATIDLIKKAVCAVAEQYQANELAGDGDAISQESVGSLSVTYAPGSTQQKTRLRKIQEAALTYLADTGLMFAGFAAGEYGGEAGSDED